MSDLESIIPGYDDPQAFSQAVFQTMVGCLRTASVIPGAGPDFEYYSTFRGFRAIMQKEKNSVLSLMKSLIPGQNIRNAFENNDVEDKYDILLDMNATVFENVGSQLDEATNSKKSSADLIITTKQMTPINTSWNKLTKKQSKDSQKFSLLSSKNIQRPQLTFKDKVDNSNLPFVPLIKEKPNSIKPLAILFETDGNDEEYSHPYEWELERFKPVENQLQTTEPISPLPVEETPLIMVDTEEQLNDMISDLRTQKEFAIDIENHSYRSLQGFACLLQLSTRQKDYIVDAIKLRSELHVLNEIFTDPTIVKVLHGADMDVLWLQRDFGVYIVNMFDTGQASRVLNFPHLSLAYLLNHYCNVEVDKQFQLADWRIRPLPSPLIKYAREDTHYLLYVYDRIKNDLLENGNESKNLLMSVLQKSKDICLKRYKKLLFDDAKYLDIYQKSRKLFDARQKHCLKALYSWRDKIARIEDESYGYILPNHMLLRIAETMPKDNQGIIACCNPVPPFVFQQLNELHGIIMQANNTPLNMLESNDCGKITQINKPIDASNFLHSLHDIHHSKDQKMVKFTVPEPGVSFELHNFTAVGVPLKKAPSLPLFHITLCTENESPTHSQKIQEKVAKSIAEDNKTPYERYLLTQQYHESTNSKDDETPVNKEVLSKSFIEVLDSSSNNCSLDTSSASVGILDPNTPIKTEKTSPESSEMMVEASEASNYTPKKKKKRKSGRAHPDMSLEAAPQPKVSKKIQIPSFQPFDYSQAHKNAPNSQNRVNPEEFNPNRNADQYKKSGKKSWRKSSGKQWHGKTSEKKSWPKN